MLSLTKHAASKINDKKPICNVMDLSALFTRDLHKVQALFWQKSVLPAFHLLLCHVFCNLKLIFKEKFQGRGNPLLQLNVKLVSRAESTPWFVFAPCTGE